MRVWIAQHGALHSHLQALPLIGACQQSLTHPLALLVGEASLQVLEPLRVLLQNASLKPPSSPNQNPESASAIEGSPRPHPPPPSARAPGAQKAKPRQHV